MKTITRQAILYKLKRALGIRPTSQWSPRCRRCIACCGTSILHLSSVTFLYITPKPPLRSWTWIYHQKANKMTYWTISCPHGNIVNFWHTSRIHFLVNNTSFCTFKRMGRKCQKIPESAPSSSGTCTPSNTSVPGPTHSPHQTTARSVHALPQN